MNIKQSRQEQKKLSLNYSLSLALIENIFRRGLMFYFILISIIILVGGWNQVGFREDYNVGDWLINYQGGFVRRGLLGEVIYLIANFLRVKIYAVLIFTEFLFFSAYFYFSWKILISKSNLMKNYILIIMSPFLFTFAINSQGGGYRKEIIYFAILAFSVYTKLFFSRKHFENLFWLLLFLFPMLILTDEVSVVILPVLLAIFLYKKTPTFKELASLGLLLCMNFLFFIIIIRAHQATPDQVSMILQSINSTGYHPKGTGAIGALTWSTWQNYQGTLHSIKYGHYYRNYSIILILSLVSFFPLKNKFIEIKKDKILVFGLLLSFLILVPIFIIANDWGRWIYIFLVEVFFIILLSDHEEQIKTIQSDHSANIQIWRLLLIGVFIFSYSMFWYMPHMLADGSDWKSFTHNIPLIK